VPPVSYRLCYHIAMAQRTKRSVSLPHDLAQEIDRAARRSGTTFSGWLAATAAHRLRLEAGRRALTAWQREHGALTAEERAEGRARARALLGRATVRPARRSA
jgi:Arc/MetJ-type ribon-helix-helix transcriptional regulator